MMRAIVLLAAAVLLTGSLAPFEAEPSMDPTTVFVGPYAGVLAAEGDQAQHRYQNAPSGAMCIQIVQPYTVVLAHAPVDAVLEVRVDSHVKTVTGGVGSMTFMRGVCTAFTIEVTLVGSELPVAYAMHVQSGPVVGPDDVAVGILA